MNISFIDLHNFRKLEECRIEFSKDTTVFVGANNSGKTSAMDALGKFLADKGNRPFIFNDILISRRTRINEIGCEWLKEDAKVPEDLSEWSNISPALDLWLNVENNEIQYVAHIIPTLKWKGGLIGIRFVFQPADINRLFLSYRQAYMDARDTESANNKEKLVNKLWPKDLCDFLEKDISKHFSMKAYILDPTKFNGKTPQNTIDLIECLTNDPLKGLIKIDMIPAQRGFSDVETKNSKEERVGGSLSTQLRSYYDKHLDPEKSPTSEDLDTLIAMENATIVFNDNLKIKFKRAINELEELGYPGISDPKITISTKVSATETLNHEAAVKYSLNKDDDSELSLPEKYNGLGYQNLISIVFQLMRFRDDWVQEGKAKKREEKDEKTIAPIHMVLLEEPEAHLHVQVQQVLIRKAYSVLRKHNFLKEHPSFTTQLVVSTHSSHIAKECSFSNLRYFKRLAATSENKVGTSKVVNLSEIFGFGDATDKFVTRYLQTTHCDVFFADAVIIIEGTAEEMLLPHFIKNKFPELNQRYVTVLRINGKHSHRLDPLLKKLAIPTLVVSDLDSGVGVGRHNKVPAKRQDSQVCTNYAVYSWIMKEKSLDSLLDKTFDEKVKIEAAPFPYNLRIAYQTPIQLKFKDNEVEAIPRTFEDAMIYTNLQLLEQTTATDEKDDAEDTAPQNKVELIEKVNELINNSKDFSAFHQKIFDMLCSSELKASFALDLIYEFDPNSITVPEYIREGLQWLQDQLKTIE